MKAVLCFFVLSVALAASHPTIYMKTDEDKLSPVLIPVSSTVVPLPIYKVSTSFGASNGGKETYDQDVKLITVKTKNKKKVGAKVKTVTREDFEKSL